MKYAALKYTSIRPALGTDSSFRSLLGYLNTYLIWVLCKLHQNPSNA